MVPALQTGQAHDNRLRKGMQEEQMEMAPHSSERKRPMTTIWTDRAWQRHLELSKVSSLYGSEQEWDFYLMDRKSFSVAQDVVFVHRETSIEFRQFLTKGQLREMLYADKLIRNMHFINWMGGL